MNLLSMLTVYRFAFEGKEFNYVEFMEVLKRYSEVE